MSKKKIDSATLEKCLECACLTFRQASRVVTQLFDEVLLPTGLFSTQLPVLVLLGVHGPMSITRLAELLVMDRTTLTRNLKPLLKKDYLAPVPTRDKRVSLFKLTP